MQKKYKCFLFDLDGTLLDTAPQFLTCLNALLKKNKKKSVTYDFVRNRVSDGVGRLIQDSFVIDENHSEFEGLRNDLLAEYHKNYLLSKTFPGVDGFLYELSKKKIDWMIVTNKPKRFFEEICHKFEWHKYAMAMVSPEDVNGKRKPDPASLDAALTKTSIKKEQSIYIGDNWRDIEAANNSGIDSALALYGYIDKKDASLLKPTSKINQIEDLINYI
jgi:phosphoglycolate phosphatase